ncbi:MAG: Alkaline phosphatase synthesis transcriptional regulatory protein PhoP [Planctomycetes bacterium]|nr:Alkaline phosphatase synthesis transcriptional regulatory protein PhoP [Planctomycetota bacterium]
MDDAHHEPPPARGAAPRVLVADDEPFILRSLSFVLERAGFEVSQATNGDQALEVLRDRRPQVCILDVMMPKRSGYEVCQVVKGDPDLRGTHVILLTAKGQDSARARGMESGADEYMTKPFSPSRIVERIREVLGGSRAPEGERIV